jgi:methionyl-tRNA formyltransferase
MRIAFLGTPAPAVPTLSALVANGHDVVLVVTRPDKKRGRGGELSPSPVKAAALELGLSVSHTLKDLYDIDAELGVVVAYGAMIPAALLEVVPMLNVHFSLLPRWRGAAPVERAILSGDPETGVCIMTLEETLDTGPVHLEQRIEVGEKTSNQLLEELSILGANALCEVVGSEVLLKNPTPQVGEATYAEKLSSETFQLRDTESATQLARIVRLGRAYTFIGGKRFKVLEAHAIDFQGGLGSITLENGVPALVASDGALVLDVVQPEGSKSMAGSQWWHGARLEPSSAHWG